MSKLLEKRHQWVLRFMVVAMCVLLGRAFMIQVIKDERVERMARRQFESKVLLRPNRGPILDRNGEALAINVESQSLAANPVKLAQRKNILRLVARALSIPPDKLQSRLRGLAGSRREFAWIKRHIKEGELNLLRRSKVISNDGELVEGLWLVRESKRAYPHHELAAHVVGDTNVDGEGLEGVELWRNQELKGSVAAFETTRDALGRATFLDAAAAGSVKDGTPVSLTIDASLQYSVGQELKLALARTGSRAGQVIVMNAVNGEILAVANEPTFDPNFPGVPADFRRNRSFTDGYEPGSTIKPVLLAAALSRGMRLGDQIWGSNGSFVVQGKRISEAEAHEKFEWITLKKMIQVSSNVASAKLALKVGSEPYAALLSQMGFGSRTGIGFPGEIPGRLPPGRSWTPLTLANVGFGQGLLVTPIQMVRAYAAFINGGWMVQPSLIRDEARQGAPRRVFSQAVAEQVLDALSSVTLDEGTGTRARLEGYEVAGKTGTAQTVDSATGKYSRTRYISSFIGFARGVEPRLVIFAALDGPKGSYYASETAAPLFQKVLHAVVNRFSIPANRLPEQAAPASQQLALGESGNSPARVDLGPALVKPVAGTPDEAHPWNMPSLIGFTAREALRLLQGRPFEIELHGNGVVRSQQPEPGSSLAGHTRIRLSLGTLQ